MIYVIGDVHGCYKTLLALIKKLPKNAKIVFVGDIVDRGNDSNKVIEFIRDNNYDCVMGNHELAMVETIEDILSPKVGLKESYWRDRYDGEPTLKSYGISDKQKDEKSIKKILDDTKWLKTLPLYLEYPNIKDKNGRHLVVSHAPFGETWKYRDLKDSLKQEDFKKRALTSRQKDPFDNKEIFNIFGHTPVENIILKNHFANIDTGCWYKDLGTLSAIEFPSKKVFIQKNIED